MLRKDVFDLIESERAYQEREWPGSQALPVTGEVLLIQSYLRKFVDAYQEDDDAPNESAPLGALKVMRKIATIAVRALENVHPDLKDELLRK